MIRHLVAPSRLTQTKVIIFSRLNIDGFRGLRGHRHLKIDIQNANADMATYLRPQIELLLKQQLLPGYDDIESVLQFLLRDAHGTFL